MSDILDSIDGLAALPQTVLQITALLSDQSASASEIEGIIRRDEAMSVAVLRWSNSARFGRPGRTFTLKEGIARLGNSTLLKIVLEQSTAKLFDSAGSSFGLERGALWRSAVGGALAAEQIARDADWNASELCFLCALVRDIGKLALDAHFGQEYFREIASNISAERTFVDAERAALGFDHAQLGAELGLRWGLPERIVNAIKYHHNPPPDVPSRDVLYDTVHAADMVALWAGLAIGHDGMQYRIAEHVRAGLGFTRRMAERLITATWVGVQEMEAIVNPATPKGVTV